MKTVLTLLLAVVITTSTRVPAADALTEALQKGLFEEEANQNLEAAIKAYQDVLSRADEQRRVAATALFRLAECYRKQGKTNEATAEYRRLLRDYTDQSTLVNLSRQNLIGLGANVAVASTATPTAEALTTDEEQKEIQRIRNLIKNSPDLINAKNRTFTPIGAAVVTGTVLHEAAFKGHFLVAEYLLANGADINAFDSHNQTPLYHAARSGHKRVVELLLAKGAQPSLGDYLPLHTVAERGFIGVTEVLLANKADVNAERQGRTALHVAIEHKNLQIAELLIAHGANVNAVYSRSWDRGGALHFLGTPDGAPLHLAVQGANPALVRLLLANGANVNLATTHAGLTPLHYVAQPHCPPETAIALTELLLQAGANINATASENSQLPGWAPLHMAVFHKGPHIVRLLLEKGADPNLRLPPQSGNEATALNMAISGGVTEIVELLLTHKADTTARDHNGDTPLVRAIRDQNRALAELLLSKGADPNAFDANGFPPLHVALGAQPHRPSPQFPPPDRSIPSRTVRQPSQGQPVPQLYTPQPPSQPSQDLTMVELLLKHKADPNLRDKQSETALHVAAERRNQSAVELLLKHKADPNARTDFGMTPLHKAVSVRQDALVDLLLAHHADVTAATKEGDTALHWAAGFGLTNIAAKLVHRGADINACGRNGETPLHRKIHTVNLSQPYKGQIDFLVKLGASVVKTCDGGITPIETAMLQKSRGLADYLRKQHTNRLAIATFEGPVKRQTLLWDANKRITLNDAINAVGLHENADPTRVTIQRTDPETGIQTSNRYDGTIVRAGEGRQETYLKHGDKITVATRID